tara:strand:- start:669 stop:872 length:204 start_codon:yes stop_codon:yes gene_type:complete
MSQYKEYCKAQEEFIQNAKDLQIGIIERNIVRLIKSAYDEGYNIGYEKGRSEDFAFTTEEVKKVLDK